MLGFNFNIFLFFFLVQRDGCVMFNERETSIKLFLLQAKIIIFHLVSAHIERSVIKNVKRVI